MSLKEINIRSSSRKSLPSVSVLVIILPLQEVAEVPPGVLIFCDDPSVQKAVNSAVTKFNEKLTTGNKLALFQIVTASKVGDRSRSVVICIST